MYVCIIVTQRQLYAREVLQSCDLSQYDGSVLHNVITVIDRKYPRSLLPLPFSFINSLTHSPPSFSSVVVVGGDGTVNEVINALVMQAQHQSGVNTRRSRFAPVSVNQRLGIIPAGMTNTIARSVLGCQDPNIAAAQIMLGGRTSHTHTHHLSYAACTPKACDRSQTHTHTHKHTACGRSQTHTHTQCIHTLEVLESMLGLE